MEIKGLQKLTLLDYPGKAACTVFTGGCNFRCPFCQNTDLVLRSASIPSIPVEDILTYLNKRKGILDGICISGGEPLLQSDIRSFIKQCRSLGYSVKLDTNGYNPVLLKSLINESLIDYVAMDIKSGLSGYRKVSGMPQLDTELIKTSVEILKTIGIEHEFRTTVVNELHSPQDFHEIGVWLDGEEHYFLQKFVDSGDILECGLTAASDDTMHEYLEIIKKYIPTAKLRGM